MEIVVSRSVSQCQRPRGWLGRIILRRMNASHSRLTDWGLAYVAFERHDAILDVGCGGGKTVGKLAGAAPQGKIYGVDVSEESVAVSTRTNAHLINTGQVEIRLASVS